MPEFGDEFIIESFKIPWLIWIQLLITILLMILLVFGFSIFTSDQITSSAEVSPENGRAAAMQNHLNNPSSSQRITKVEDPKMNRDAGTSGGIISEEEDQIVDESSLKDSMFLKIFQHPNHPCNFFGQAKKAIFKCFGLDSGSENPRNYPHEKSE